MKYLIFIILFLTGTFVSNAQESVVNIKVISPNDNPAESVIVYAITINATGKVPVNTQPLIVDQKNKKFTPYITVLQKGQQIKFANQDDITHHIYSVSGENRFEFKLKAGEQKLTQQMMATEEVAMGCNIHDWMSGYALVVDTPYYAKSDGDGVAQLTLPFGEYQLTVWHPQLDLDKNSFGQKLLVNENKTQLTMKLPKALLPIPTQTGQDEFEFLEEYE